MTQDLSEDYIDSFAPKYGDKFKIPDFFEDMVYNPREGVMMVGTYASKEEAKKKGNKINNVGVVVQDLVLPTRTNRV